MKKDNIATIGILAAAGIAGLILLKKSGVSDSIGSGLAGAGSAAADFGNTVGSGLAAAGSGLADIGNTIGSGFATVGDVAKKNFGSVKTIATSNLSAVSGVTDAVKDAAKTIASGDVVELIKTTPERNLKTVTDTVGSISGAIGSSWLGKKLPKLI